MTDSYPLVVVADDAVREHIARIAAAVGCEPRYAEDLDAARPHWGSAPLVLVDQLQTGGAAPGVVRRRGVLLVCSDPPTDPQWRAALAFGVDTVAHLPAEEDVVVSALADVADQPSPQRGPVVAVVPGSGGAGASVLATAVGIGAARAGDQALLLDCDPLGGGVDLLLGAESEQGVRWPDLRVSAGRVSMTELDAALPTRRYGAGRLAVLSCDRAGPGPTDNTITAVVEAGSRAGRTVVCDLPRRLDGSTDAVLRYADLVVLVVPADVRGCVAAARLRGQLFERGARIGVVVRDRETNGLSSVDIADAIGEPVLCRMRDTRGLDRVLDRGGFAPMARSRIGRTAQEIRAAVLATQDGRRGHLRPQ